ncbi:MAG: class II fumarate hydratase [Deltaproteobacteria bacterium]|nr:class II fumarate hydratase [Deltaproteobacteria bacterium]
MITREEKDSLGTVLVPQEAYYGAQTQRAVDNFPISGLRFPRRFIRVLGLLKKNAAITNQELGLLPKELAEPIITAAQEVADGGLDSQFVVDVFQTGSGTSTNMNANEVIAGRANEILTGKRGFKVPVHPNDHVNMGQSSNDVFPTVIHAAALTIIKDRLIPSLAQLHQDLSRKALEFAAIKKIGRTHLQDAGPISLGQEFGGYARQIELGIKRVTQTRDSLSELALGGTAVGTGLNTHPEFAPKTITLLSRELNCALREAENHFEAQAARDAAVEVSGALKTLAVSLIKIANDIRWLASGPRCGLGEIHLPSLQPGSSIMPGKVNPVLPEAVIQVAVQVIGHDSVITLSGQAGSFELNTMMPVIAYNLLQSLDILSSVTDLFARKCVQGISVNLKRVGWNLEQSLALATQLTPAIGYDQAALIAERAYESGKTVQEAAIESGLLPEKKIMELLKQDG